MTKSYKEAMTKWAIDRKIPLAIGGAMGIGVVIYIVRSWLGSNDSSGSDVIGLEVLDSKSNNTNMMQEVVTPGVIDAPTNTLQQSALLSGEEQPDSHTASLQSELLPDTQAFLTAKSIVYTMIMPQLRVIMEFSKKVQLLDYVVPEGADKSEIHDKVLQCEDQILEFCFQLDSYLQHPGQQDMNISNMNNQISQFKSNISKFWSSIQALRQKQSFKEQGQIKLEMDDISEFIKTIDELSTYISSSCQTLNKLNELNNPQYDTPNTRLAIGSPFQKEVNGNSSSPAKSALTTEYTEQDSSVVSILTFTDALEQTVESIGESPDL